MSQDAFENAGCRTAPQTSKFAKRPCAVYYTPAVGKCVALAVDLMKEEPTKTLGFGKESLGAGHLPRYEPTGPGLG